MTGHANTTVCHSRNMEDEQLTYKSLRENGILLFETLKHTMTESETVKLRPPKRDKRTKRLLPARTSLLVAYASHALTLMGTVIDLLDKNRVIEATPIIRSGYEMSLQSQWLYLVGDDAANALANEHGRLRKAMKDDAEKSNSPYLRGMANEIGDSDWVDVPTNSRDQAKNTKTMLRDINVGSELYVYYRLMSEYCHPSMLVVDQYIHGEDENNYYPTFQHAPKQPDPSMWMFFMLLSACHAAYPISTILRDKTLRDTIRRIGRDCHISLDLKLSGEYFKRLRKVREKNSQAM